MSYEEYIIRLYNDTTFQKIRSYYSQSTIFDILGIAAFELKYFPKSDGETVTDNRFYVLADIENLKTYRHLGIADLCYFILYTTNKNYTTDAHHQAYRFGRTSILRVQRRKLALEVLPIDVVGQQGQFVATVDEVGEHRAEKFRCRADWLFPNHTFSTFFCKVLDALFNFSCIYNVEILHLLC